ncbi:MAG: hypothetical protein ACXWQO_02265 [Bdellovibrionota bacterium]
MKILNIFLLSALFFSCSKTVPELSAVALVQSLSSNRAVRILEESFRYDSASVQAAASAVVKAGVPLRSATAEACWNAESGRRDVALACLLAWSIGTERSALLERELGTWALKNRIAGIAAVRMKLPLQNFGAGELNLLLTLLKDDPIWLRANATLLWLQTHAVPPISTAEEIAVLLQDSKPVLPADFRYSYLARRALKPATASAMLNDHCGPLVTGDLRVRCWRFLSAFVDPVSGEGLPASLQAWVPPSDRAWQLFQLAMPERARLMKHYLNR